MNTFYRQSLNSAREKYFKFKHRLEKKISSGQFDTLSRKKKNQLVSRVEKYRTRLDQLGFSMKGAAVAGSVAAMAAPAMVTAQNPYFRNKFNLPINGGNNVHQVEVVNLDADADLEILISSDYGGKIFDKQADGTFAYTAETISGMDDDFVVGDIDGNGSMDIVFERSTNSGFYKAINDGVGSFSATQISSEYSFGDADLVDFDSDGDLDFLWADSNDYIFYLRNTGGEFDSSYGMMTFDGGEANAYVTHFEFVDFDKDGDMDLVRDGDYNDGISQYKLLTVVENTRDDIGVPIFGGSNDYVFYGSYSSFTNLVVADLDGDGDIDIAIDQSISGSRLRFFENLYSAGDPFSFSASGHNYIGYIYDIAITDFDDDGSDDLIVASSYGEYVAFGGESDRDDIYGISGYIYGFGLGDLDGDGRDDIVTIEGEAYYDITGLSYAYLGVDEFSERKAKSGDIIGRLSFKDPLDGDITPSALSILPDNDGGLFDINGSGEISVGLQDLDFESQNEFNITVEGTYGIATREFDFTLRMENTPEEGYGTFEKLDEGGETSYRMYESRLADLNGDGNDDLIFSTGTGSSGIYTLDIANEGTPQYLRNGYAFEVADLDNDGDHDVAIASAAYIYFFINDGGGNFAQDGSANTYGSTITDIEIVDIDNDGDNDFVIGNYGNGGIVKDFGDYFSSVTSFGLTGNVRNVALGDIDDDGFEEILHIDGNGNYLGLVNNDGGSYFSRITTYDVGYTYRVEISDLDNDGDADILTFNSNNFRVLDNDGDGTFTYLPAVYASSSMPRTAMALGDFDGDEDIDVILRGEYENYGGEEGVVYINNGDNSFSQRQSIEFSGAIGTYNRTSLTGLAVGDIDGDDDLDVVFGTQPKYGSGDERIIGILKNQNVAPYVSGFTGSVIIDENTPSGTIIGYLDTYDPNGDDVTISLEGDDSDLLSLNSAGRLRTEGEIDWEVLGSTMDVNLVLSDGNSQRVESGRIKVNNLTEKGSGTFSTEGLPLFGIEEALFFQVGDYDLDGDQDLFKSYYTDNEELLDSFFPNSVFEQVGNGIFADNPIFYSSGHYVKHMVFHDIDNDGDKDILAATDDGILASFINEDGAFAYTDNSGNLEGAIGMELGDFDGDGAIDLVVLEDYFNRTYVSQFEYLGDEFGKTSDIPLSGISGAILSGGEGSQIAVADFDGDGVDDVFVAVFDGDDIILEGGEGGISSSRYSVAITQNDNGWSKVTTNDFDNDGDIDVAILRRTSADSDNLRLDIHLNDGDGSFTLSETKTQDGYDYGEVRSGDIDGDGMVDLITTGYINYDSGTYHYDLTIWGNAGDGTFEELQKIEEVGGEQIKLMDVDGDDDLDIVVNDYSNYLKVFKNINVAPTGIELSSTTLDEGLPLGSAIATVSVEDPNPSDTHVSFVATGDGSNDTDNSNFVIDGDQLLVIKNIEFNDGSTLNINIKAIDQDGASVSQSFTLSVNEVLGLDDTSQDFILYPNPGHDRIAISIDNKEKGKLEMRVIDVSGKVIHQIKDRKKSSIWITDIDMTAQESGIYVVEIDINGQKFKQRWIKK
ncbi:FG-GAP-like repeat-containing protein [Ekhidna sp.]|jgi:hypothetical protein|uniref:FG-GAP-like repeat-containing protein n=1 Tax=Ekhidna sp. TaxID=2608089 RepID=UPI0032ED5FF2